VVVDELAALTAYTDRDTKRDASALLQLLLSQGRAVGIVVVAAVQDPGKDVIPFRDLFPTRIALRLLEEEQVTMVLGRSARNRGALCDLIPDTLPGVGYVQVEGVREPVRIRAAYVSDDDIADLAANYAPGRGVDTLNVTAERLDRSMP
jgi:S-DNA-T family DNA segregation ATPase FtsK/SpoIIIE